MTEEVPRDITLIMAGLTQPQKEFIVWLKGRRHIDVLSAQRLPLVRLGIIEVQTLDCHMYAYLTPFGQKVRAHIDNSIDSVLNAALNTAYPATLIAPA